MGTPATGELRPLAHGWEARIRIEGKRRKCFPLVLTDEREARERCTAMAQMAVRLRSAGHVAQIEELLSLAARARNGPAWDAVTIAVDALCTEGGAEKLSSRAAVTFRTLAEEWTSGRLHVKYPDVVDLKATSEIDGLRFGKWIYPVVEDVPLHLFTEEHAQEVMRRIPPTKSRATRRHIGHLVIRVLALAAYPCKYIERSPIPEGFLPKSGKNKAMTYLYPSEDRQLLACNGVPMSERLLFGVLAREGLRCEEALSLRWLHLDLVRGSVRVDINKTDDPRAWALDASVVRTLRWWKAQHPDAQPTDRVFPHAPTRLAARLRGYLQIAGIHRAELFERNAARRPLRAHDLRATFVTVNLANGKSEAWISDRTGHTSSAMINRYRRCARAHSELGQGNLTPLDEALSLPHERPTAGAGPRSSGDLLGNISARTAISAESSEVIEHSSGYDRPRDRSPDR